MSQRDDLAMGAVLPEEIMPKVPEVVPNAAGHLLAD
jgi:hypothetical protein